MPPASGVSPFSMQQEKNNSKFPLKIVTYSLKEFTCSSTMLENYVTKSSAAATGIKQQIRIQTHSSK
jgi:hypothetical protein